MRTIALERHPLEPVTLPSRSGPHTAADPVRVETARTFDGLAAHRAAWDRLAAEAPHRSRP